MYSDKTDVPIDDDAEFRELKRRWRAAEREAEKRAIEKRIRDLSGGFWV